MNILLINHYSGSRSYGMEFRPYYMGIEWFKRGHNVTIVGASQSHLRLNQPKVTGRFMKEEIDGLKYIWMRTPKYKTTLTRIINILSFVFSLIRFHKAIIKEARPDIVIASSTYPLDIFPARRIAKRSHAKLCFEVHDLWPLSPMMIGGYSKYHPFIIIMQIAENYAYKNADVIVSFLDKALPHMMNHGLKPEKFNIVPNGFCKEEWDNCRDSIPQEHQQLFDTLKRKGKLIIGYAGGHAPSNALRTLIDAAYELRNDSKIVFILVGDGPSKESLIKIVNDRMQNNVFFLSSISKVAIPDLISRFDIAYMGGVKSVLHKHGTSFNKMTDYMVSAKPIIFSTDEPDSLIDRVNCGITVAAEDSGEVIEAIKTLLILNSSELIEMGERGKAYAESNLEYGILTERMLDILEKN